MLNIIFLKQTFIYPILNRITYYCEWVVSLCRKNQIKPEDFLEYCIQGDIEKIKKIISHPSVNIDNGLRIAVEKRNIELISYFLRHGASNLDECLRTACENNNYCISDMLLSAGAKPLAGLRVAKSPNIIRMLYRYEHKSEMIN
jgi:hypothetical protein